MADAPDGLSQALADRYALERELSAGGMATVYPAADLKHPRMVAIKVLRPEVAAVVGAKRFRPGNPSHRDGPGQGRVGLAYEIRSSALRSGDPLADRNS